MLHRTRCVQVVHARGYDTTHLYVFDDDAARNRVLAVSARAVQLAKVHDGEAVDGDGPLAIVLDHLVLGGLRAAALDHCVAVALDGERVLAHGDPPDVFDGAGALAVDAFDLVWEGGVVVSGPGAGLASGG